MQIIYVPFEESLIININDEIVNLVPFKTLDRGNIKFGITAPRTINVHREEIYVAINKQRLVEYET